MKKKFKDLLNFHTPAKARHVFAHFLVGVAGEYTEDTWKTDIQLAQSSGIDGFTLNIAPPWTGTIAAQVKLAFKAANGLGSNFKLFFSFDYLGGSSPWPICDVIHILQIYADNSAYYQFRGAPLVSTFEGTGNVCDWPRIRASVISGISFVPNWTSLGPVGVSSHPNVVDGTFSWDMWPDGPHSKSMDSDITWKKALGPKKAYMMGVSPWFYTNLPQYHKAFVWRGDSLWHERWKQVMSLDPDLVQIVSWNDYGESHYIGPIHEAGIPAGASSYVSNMPHDHWRDLLPYYIAQYKAGGIAPTVHVERLQYWYRLIHMANDCVVNSVVTGNHCRSPVNCYGYQKCYYPSSIVQDKVFVTALLQAPATVRIQIGSNEPVNHYTADTGASHFEQPFNGQTGAVKVSVVRHGQVVYSGSGESIHAMPQPSIEECQHYDYPKNAFNAWVGGFSA